MIKVEVIENFTLEDYKKLKNVKKVTNRKENEFGVKDTFECDEKMVDYLTGNNALNKVVVKVVEVIPEIDITETEFDIRSKEVKKLLDEDLKTLNKIEETLKQEKPKKTTKKKTSKK